MGGNEEILGRRPKIDEEILTQKRFWAEGPKSLWWRASIFQHHGCTKAGIEWGVQITLVQKVSALHLISELVKYKVKSLHLIISSLWIRGRSGSWSRPRHNYRYHLLFVSSLARLFRLILFISSSSSRPLLLVLFVSSSSSHLLRFLLLVSSSSSCNLQFILVVSSSSSRVLFVFSSSLCHLRPEIVRDPQPVVG